MYKGQERSRIGISGFNRHRFETVCYSVYLNDVKYMKIHINTLTADERLNTAVSRKVVQNKRTRRCRKVVREISNKFQ